MVQSETIHWGTVWILGEFQLKDRSSASIDFSMRVLSALLIELERVNIKKERSIAKIIGTVIMVPGAVIMTLYKGPAINFIKLQGGSHHTATNEAEAKHWVAGTLMLLARCRDTFTHHTFPELSLTALICFIGTIGGAAVSFAMERDMSAWKIDLIQAC
ncbi:putative Cation transport protein chaC [Hibiscus syriacus]|uniref:Cation transport protein chaC n=1 Tax=Hibiscus syriacus TaxID=106335 RepID=A0A6A2Z029_HIBSY|nr:putative Cation transport protein chaC [Hibiscus syriacus]